MSDQGSSYAAAGVDIDAAHRSLRTVADSISATHNSQVIGGIGGFGAMFEPNFTGMNRPILVSSIDGVGTKTKVAAMVGDYKGIGRDIVNHCVNDILCQGARPLFFLDYFGCSHLEEWQFEQVVRSAAEACSAVGCALVGGETAEMPGVYLTDEIDIVGSIVGVVDFEARLPRSKPRVGDRLIGIASNGLHTNGYSLARKVLFDRGGLTVNDSVPDSAMSIGEALLLPHTCYYNELYPLLQQDLGIYGLAHITGGGIYDNLQRILPQGLGATIERSTWTPLPIFRLIQQVGEIPQPEMDRAFNQGIGMIAVVDQESADHVVVAINQAGLIAAEIGALNAGQNDVQIV